MEEKLELNDELVFGREDLVMITHEHASDISRGIVQPLTFTIIRHGQIYSGESLYFYNPNYAHWPSNDGLKALLSGILDALSLGFDDEIYSALSDDPQKAYDYIENKFRLQQFYKGHFFVGNISSAILSPVGLILKGPVKKILKVGLGRKLSGVVATALVEGIENAAWTYGNNHVSYTPAEFKKMIKTNFKYGAGFGMAFGTFFQILN